MDIILRQQKGEITQAQAVEEMARLIGKEAPGLEDLSPEQLEAVARTVLGQRLARELDKKADLAGIDYQEEKQTFLDNAGNTKSIHTRRAYQSALDRLDTWTAFKKVDPLALTPRFADDYAYSLAQEGKSPATVRRDLAAASSFFTFLERRHDAIRNPFRGTKARPQKKAARETQIPTMKEARLILGTLTGELKAAGAVMVYRGLRVGGLPSLAIKGNRFTTTTKGKEQTGELPQEALDALAEAGLDPRRPFACLKASQIADRFKYNTQKLHQAGKIAGAYSVHDLRHLYAVTRYQKTRDIYQLSKALGHASIQVTETYLKGLGEID